jgi:hypothetical protein
LLLRGERGHPILELHWAFVPPYFSASLDTAAFWERREEVLLGNRAVRALQPRDLLLVLCLHGAKHGWSHLGLIGDVARLLTCAPLPWEELLLRARENGIHRMVLLAAALASRVFETALDEPVAGPIEADPAVSILAGEIITALFGKNHDETAVFSSGLLHMRMRERFRDRVKYGYRLLTRPAIEDWQMIDLPRPLSFLYPLLRYPRLALKYWSKGAA